MLEGGGLFLFFSSKCVPDGLIGLLVGECIESLKEGGLFPLISPKWVPDGLVGWLVGEGFNA